MVASSSSAKRAEIHVTITCASIASHKIHAMFPCPWIKQKVKGLIMMSESLGGGGGASSVYGPDTHTTSPYAYNYSPDS